VITNANPIIGPRRVREEEEELRLSRVASWEAHAHARARGGGLGTPRRKERCDEEKILVIESDGRGDVNSLQRADASQCQNISFSSSSSALLDQRRIDVFSSRDRISGTNGAELVDEKCRRASRSVSVLLRAWIFSPSFGGEKNLPRLGNKGAYILKVKHNVRMDAELFWQWRTLGR